MKLLLAAVACYAALALVVYLMQARMLYLADLPGRALDKTPADIDVDYVENITFVDDAKILLLTPAAVLGSRKGS